jgi:hypothetical protein
MSLTTTGLLGLVGMLLGGLWAVADKECQQVPRVVAECGNCTAGFSGGAPPAGWSFVASFSDSCQGATECADCCFEGEATVSGTGAWWVGLYGLDAGTSDWDNTAPYIAQLQVTSLCKTDANTFVCAKAEGGYNGSGDIETRCFNLQCLKCAEP